MKKRQKKSKPKDDTPILIEKVELLTDDEKRGWFPFWTLEPDEKWYGSWWSNYGDVYDKKRVLDIVFQDYIRTNFSGNGVMAMRLHLEDGSICEYHYTCRI